MSFTYLLICLLAGIGIIVLLTAKYRVHAFFALLVSCFVVGLGVHMPVTEVINTVKDGFGSIMRSLGLVIVLGTTLGVLLEHTGSTRVMASWILKKLGESRAPMAMSITGFIVGLPIFCDSGFIVLSGLNRSMAKRTAIPVAVMAVSLATGLYSVHCLIPPHPGASAAAGILKVDIGKLIIYGILIAIPASMAGYYWAVYAGKKEVANVTDEAEMIIVSNDKPPSTINAFLPVIVPILLIAIRSVLMIAGLPINNLVNIFIIAGDPVIALSAGILLAFNGKRGWKRTAVSSLLQDAAEKAGGILVIIAAGGSFGAILAATKIGEHLGASLSLGSLGIFFPFLLAFLLKTAQGSSTVAIITASSIIQPLLPALGLATGTGPLLCVLSMGAGSMMISHANDAYFWVIAKFSGLEMKTMLRVYTIASICMGLTGLLMVFLLSKII